MAIKEDIQNRKSKVISASLNKYLITKGKVLVNEGKFSSTSDVVAIVLTEFFVREELKNEGNEGEALIRSILRKSLAAPAEQNADIVTTEDEKEACYIVKAILH